EGGPEGTSALALLVRRGPRARRHAAPHGPDRPLRGPGPPREAARAPARRPGPARPRRDVASGAAMRPSRSAIASLALLATVLVRSAVTTPGLARLEAVVVPGGWAPSIAGALGADGLAALRAFVSKGGRYVGVCAGAYLAAREVRWEGQAYPYPLGLFPGVAE